MHNFYKLILGIMLFLSAAFAEELIEGKDYIVLSKPLNVTKPSIIEVFNIGCPYCAKMQDILQSLFAILPENVEFLAYHIITSAPFSKEASQVLAVSFALDKMQGTSIKNSKSHFKRAMGAFFDANFKTKQSFKNAQLFIEYGLKAAGISEQDFKKTLDSNAKPILETWNLASKIPEIQGVPTFIINGKYLILSQALKDQEDFFYKVDYLLHF